MTRPLSVLTCTLALAAARPDSLSARQFLPSAASAAAASLTPLGNLEPARQIEFTIMLPLRNQAGLDQLVSELYDPGSPRYRHFLTLEEFTEQFGPTPEDYQALLDFAANNGLDVAATYPCRNVLALRGSVSAIQQAFHTTLRTYANLSQNRTCFAPDSPLSIDIAVPILEVDGLDNFGTAQHHHTARPLGTDGATPNSGGSGPSSTFWGRDFQNVYAPGANLSGAGQIVGLFQYDGYYGADITNYFKQSGLTNSFPFVPLQNIILDNATNYPSSDANAVGEVSLDIEMSIAMAPGLSKVVVFEGSAIPPIQIITAMSTNTAIKQFSSSWTWGASPGGINTAGVDSLLKQMIAQGQCYFQASGDSCAYTSTIDDPGMVTIPATSTNVVAVGGTTLTAGAGTNYASETVWNWGGGTGSSGGISTYYNIPPWQQGISMTLNQGSITKRNLPDVAMVGDQIYVIYNNGSVGSFGGTSCAAPLWAGFNALVNQKAVAAGRPTVGFISPAIYAIAKSANYATDFHDVTTGNNFNSSSPSLFSAVAGLDLCTGLGSPNGLNLITALATPDSLIVSPGTGFSATGPVGGPFSPNSQIFTLTNSSSSNLTWTATLFSSWLSTTLTSGSLLANTATNVAINLVPAVANALPPGTYSANVSFNNTSSGVSQSRTFTLNVTTLELVQNGGFETGNFAFWSLSGDWMPYSIVSGPSLIMSTLVSPNSGNYLAFLASNFGGLGFMQQDLSTTPGQFYMLSFWYNGTDGETPNNLQAVWGGSQVANLSNLPIPWTNFRKVVLATNSVTTLLFAFQDDPSFLGVDDVSVQPVPAPYILGSTNTASNFSFTWSTVQGAKYQVQGSTVLSSGWSSIGGPITASGSTLSYSELKSGTVKFYRVALTP